MATQQNFITTFPFLSQDEAFVDRGLRKLSYNVLGRGAAVAAAAATNAAAKKPRPPQKRKSKQPQQPKRKKRQVDDTAVQDDPVETEVDNDDDE